MKHKPPRIVQSIHFTTSFFLFRCPASTANTIVTEDMIKIKVIIPTNTNGWPDSAIPGIDWNTLSASIHVGCANFCAPYIIRNAENVKVSDTKKNHIMIFPYSKFQGDLPPFHGPSFTLSNCDTVVVLIFYYY